MNNPTPLIRACLAIRLPKGLFTDQGGLYLKDSQIRANLRKQHVGAERLVLALADMFEGVSGALSATDAWMFADVVVRVHDLPASIVGALAFAAMLPEEGAVEPDEWGFFVEAAP